MSVGLRILSRRSMAKNVHVVAVLERPSFLCWYLGLVVNIHAKQLLDLFVCGPCNSCSWGNPKGIWHTTLHVQGATVRCSIYAVKLMQTHYNPQHRRQAL